MLLLNVFPSKKYEKYNFKIFYGMHHKIIFFLSFLVPCRIATGNINNHNNINYIKNPYMAYIQSNNNVLGFLVVDSNDMFIAVIC